MNATNAHFWLERLTETVEQAVAARTERTRAAYLELACHYRSMYKLTCRPTWHEDVGAPAEASAEASGQDFGSVHDVLMQAA